MDTQQPAAPPSAERTYACLLFAVNVGGRSVPSVALRELADALGFADSRTVANSGNLVVRPGSTGVQEAAEAATLLTTAVAERFEVEAAIAVLTGTQIAAAVAANPFPGAAAERPATVQLLVGTRPVDSAGVAEFAAARSGTERLVCAGGLLYIDYPDGIGASTLTTRTLAKAAGTPVTGRNWNTVLKLARLTT